MSTASGREQNEKMIGGQRRNEEKTNGSNVRGKVVRYINKLLFNLASVVNKSYGARGVVHRIRVSRAEITNYTNHWSLYSLITLQIFVVEPKNTNTNSSQLRD